VFNQASVLWGEQAVCTFCAVILHDRLRVTRLYNCRTDQLSNVQMHLGLVYHELYITMYVTRAVRKDIGISWPSFQQPKTPVRAIPYLHHISQYVGTAVLASPYSKTQSHI